jgi:hypothetical protein
LQRILQVMLIWQGICEGTGFRLRVSLVWVGSSGTHDGHVGKKPKFGKAIELKW